MKLIDSRDFSRGVANSQRRGPMAMPPNSPEGEPHEEAILDMGLLRDVTRFAWHAITRHFRLVAAIVAAFAVFGAFAALFVPVQYYSETKLLADKNVVMPLLGNPSRSLPSDADTPTRLASDFITNYESLVKIVDSVKLVDEVERSRSIWGRLRLTARGMLGRTVTDEERLDEAVSLLRDRMSVEVGEGTITIQAMWTDPSIAMRIVRQAQENFVAGRQAQEQALIVGSIEILEAAAGSVAIGIQRTMDSLSRQRRALTPTEVGPFTGGQTVIRINPELMAARQSLEEATRTLADLQQSRARRLQDLQVKLEEQRNTYGPAHPEIQSTEQNLRSLLTEPTQFAELRLDIERYRARVAQLGGNTMITGSNDQALAAAAIRSLEGIRSDSLIQEKQVYGRTRLKIALASYEELLGRLDAARMELNTARATFKFKYGVLNPPTVPRQAVSRIPLIVVGATILGLMMGALTALALDLGRGRILESWQIERSLGLPVLGEAKLARLRA